MGGQCGITIPERGEIKKPNTRVYYNLQEIGKPDFTMVLDDFVKEHKLV